MAGIETPRFPDSISVGSKFGPGYSTSAVENTGGFEMVNRNWTFPKHQGDVSFGVVSPETLDQLLAFFHEVAGRFKPFRFKNFNDFSASGSEGVVVAIDASNWQMYKKYTFGSITPQRKISKPLASGITIAGGGSYSYDPTTGVINKTGGADPTGWTGEFDFWVRFDDDVMMPQWISFELYDWSPVPIIEVKL